MDILRDKVRPLRGLRGRQGSPLEGKGDEELTKVDLAELKLGMTWKAGACQRCVHQACQHPSQHYTTRTHRQHLLDSGIDAVCILEIFCWIKIL